MKPTQIQPTHKESAPTRQLLTRSFSGLQNLSEYFGDKKFSWVAQITADWSTLDCSAPFHPLILTSTTSSTILWQSLCPAVDGYMPGQEIPCRSQCLCNLRYRSATARLLALWVQIPLKVWKLMSCVCCVLCRFRGVCVCVSNCM